MYSLAAISLSWASWLFHAEKGPAMSASEIESSPLYDYDPGFRFVGIKDRHRSGQMHYRVDHELEITIDSLV
jgi:hypothetical protein